ncbi:hypothetical protein, partial [Neisseria meningitidis]
GARRENILRFVYDDDRAVIFGILKPNVHIINGMTFGNGALFLSLFRNAFNKNLPVFPLIYLSFRQVRNDG